MIQSCGCCSGVERATPVLIENRPGLSRLLYRVGTHSAFFETMLARLGTLSWNVSPEEIHSWDFGQEDILDPIGFTVRFRDHSDAVSHFLFSSFSDSTRQELAKYAGCAAPPDDLLKALLSDLNAILKKENIFGPDRFSGVAITEEIRALIERNPQGRDRDRLNRLLVEAAFGSAVARIESYYPLRKLTTRSVTDTSIALLDSWAVVGDVLTFYEERIANEGYLRTATERNSVLQLARLVGYRPRPGVASSTYLAFTMEKDHAAIIPLGTRAQSLPGPGQLPQPFETSDKLEASAEWNDLAPRLTKPMYLTAEILSAPSDPAHPLILYFDGVATQLKPGDPLLFLFENDPPVFRYVDSVTPQAAKKNTLVTLQDVLFSSLAMAHVAALMDIVNRHQQLADFNVSPATGTARRVTAFLKKQSEALSKLSHSPDQPTNPVELESFLDQLLRMARKEISPVVEEEHADAERNRHRQLEQWLGQLKKELASASGSIASSLTESRARRTAFSAISPAPPKFATGASFAGVLASLSLRPLTQPQNAFRLERSASDIYHLDRREGAVKVLPDIAPQLVVAIDPSLGDTLYAAIENAHATFAPALESANAMRVKAAIFGHNAPLKPILDNKGIIIDHEEWPLADVVSFRLDFDNHAAERATVSIRRNEVVETFTVSGIRDTNLFQNKWKLEVGSDKQANKYEFTGPDQAKTIITKQVVAGGPDVLLVTINSDPPQEVGRGQTVRYSGAGQQVTISNQESAAFILSEVSLPNAAVGKTLALDAEYDRIIPGSRVVLEIGSGFDPAIRRVLSVRTVSKAAYGITGTVTELTLDSSWIPDGWLAQNNNSLSAYRHVTVFAQNEALELAEEPITGDVSGSTVELDGVYRGLKSGRWLIVAGERSDIPGTSGVHAAELVMLAKATQGIRQVPVGGRATIDLPGDKIHTTLEFAPEGLAYHYKRDTVIIYGNVVNATHGETRAEVLGSGDGAKTLQRFALRQSPVTYLSAPTQAGAASTLLTRVNNILWHEAESLAALGPSDHGYITKTDDSDKTTVVFGNGVYGARLPSGAENVKAVYRTGIGSPGNVNANQISLLATKPYGVKAVINPLAATGGSDRDTRDQARRNIPIATLSLDRLVSVQDYADFSRAYAGIGKAAATRLSDGRRQVVEVTIAGNDDIPISRNSDLYRNLLASLRDFGDPYEPIQLDLRALSLLVISANVRLLPDYLWEAVEPKIRRAVLDIAGFDRCELAQDVLLSEIVAAMQAVEGVDYVDVDLFSSISESIASVPDDLEHELLALTGVIANRPRPRLRMKSAHAAGGRIWPAQLAYLSPAVPDTLILKEIKS